MTPCILLSEFSSFNQPDPSFFFGFFYFFTVAVSPSTFSRISPASPFFGSAKAAFIARSCELNEQTYRACHFRGKKLVERSCIFNYLHVSCTSVRFGLSSDTPFIWYPGSRGYLLLNAKGLKQLHRWMFRSH